MIKLSETVSRFLYNRKHGLTIKPTPHLTGSKYIEILKTSFKVILLNIIKPSLKKIE